MISLRCSAYRINIIELYTGKHPYVNLKCGDSINSLVVKGTESNLIF